MENNEQLVDHLIRKGVLKTQALVAAFRAVDRADFVPRAYLRECYGDYPLPIGQGQTISQPYTVAFMLERLHPREGDAVLDIGSGSGWTTALLAHVAGPRGRVLGMEIVPELVGFGQDNLAAYDFPWAGIVAAAGGLGRPGEQFDRILVSASAPEMPLALYRQLKVGGRLVIPVRQSICCVAHRAPGDFAEEEFAGFVFVPLIT